MHRFLDEGEQLWLKWSMAFAILIATVLLWPAAYGADTREERSAPYDRTKLTSTSMLYEPEWFIAGWDITHVLDFIESGKAAATTQQWAEALHKIDKIAHPEWQSARAYLATLRWRKQAAAEWYRLCRILRPVDAPQPGQLDCDGYERAVEAEKYGLHDPKTGELVVTGDSGHVVVKKLTAAAAVAAPPARTQLPTPPTAPGKTYVVWILRDPGDRLMSADQESADVDERRARDLMADPQSGVSRVKIASGIFTLTLYDLAALNPKGRGYNCDSGASQRRYELESREGYGLIQLPLDQNMQARCISIEMSAGLRRILSLKKPSYGRLDFVPSQRQEPTNLWFVVW